MEGVERKPLSIFQSSKLPYFNPTRKVEDFSHVLKGYHPNSRLLNKEKQILEFWRENDIFEKSMEMYKDAPSFVFLEGPRRLQMRPPGVHHVLARIMKDAVCRYRDNDRTLRPPQSRLGHPRTSPSNIRSKSNSISQIRLNWRLTAVQNFIEKCKENVFQYEQDWRRMTERIGFWVKPRRCLYHVVKRLY